MYFYYMISKNNTHTQVSVTLYQCEVYICNGNVLFQYQWENEFVAFTIIF